MLNIPISIVVVVVSYAQSLYKDALKMPLFSESVIERKYNGMVVVDILNQPNTKDERI